MYKPISFDEALIGETMVWPNFFLMNVFFALKGSKLFIIITLKCKMSCPLIKKKIFLNISKQQALAAFACVLKDENRNMLMSKIYIKACRYYFSRFHLKFSCGLRYFSVAQNEILITKYTITLA